MAGITLLFVVGYSGFLIASRSHGEDTGKTQASATTLHKAPALERKNTNKAVQESPEKASSTRILDRNGQPVDEGERPTQGQLVASAKKKPLSQAAKDAAARARALVESQAITEAEQNDFTPRFGNPGNREDVARSRHRRENAWTMAKDRQMPGTFLNRGKTKEPNSQDDILEDDLDGRMTPSPSPEEEPPAIVASGYYSKGLDSQMLGRLDEARAYYSKSLAEDPEYAPSLNNRAVIDMETGMMDEARKGFAQAMNADPAYVDPCYNLACLHARQGNLEEALSFLKMAAGMDKAVLDWARNDEDLAVLKDRDDFKEVMND